MSFIPGLTSEHLLSTLLYLFVQLFEIQVLQRVSKKTQLRRDGVATRRYSLCYTISLNASHNIQLIGKKISLPFAILVGPKSDVEARLFLERSFSDLVRLS